MTKFRVEFYGSEAREFEGDFWGLFPEGMFAIIKGEQPGPDEPFDGRKVKTVALYHWHDISAVERVPEPPQSGS
jgi:hypothetical protein